MLLSDTLGGDGGVVSDTLGGDGSFSGGVADDMMVIVMLSLGPLVDPWRVWRGGP